MDRNIFTLKTLTKIYEQIKPPHSSIWDKAIGKEVAEKTQKFEVHTKNAGRLRAPLVGKREKGVFIAKTAFETTTYEPPMIKLFTINEAEEMFEQKFGKTEYASPEGAAKEELARELKELRDIAHRTKIWMLMTLLTTGVCPMGAKADVGIKYNPDFTQEVLTDTNTFKNPDYDIVGYLEKKQMTIYQDTGIEINAIVVAPDVVPYILSNKSVMADQQNVNSNLIQLSQKVETLSDGMKLVAFLPKLNLTIYSYIDWAKAPDEVEEQQLLPKGTIVGFQEKSFEVRYGALALREKAGVKAKIFIAKEVVRTWYPDDSEDDELQYYSAPLIFPKDAAAYFCSKVLEDE